MITGATQFVQKYFHGIDWNITFDIRWKFVPESNGWR
jgi:hypothetical protein